MMLTLRFASETNGHTKFNNRRFDVVVLTAGAHPGPLTCGSSQLPIIGLSRCYVAFTANSGAVASTPLADALERVAPGMVALSSSGNLVAYKVSDGGGAESIAEDRFIVQGLMSFDSTSKSVVNVVGMLKRLEKYLRVRCGLDISLLPEYQKQRLQRDGVAEGAAQPNHMTVTRYIRSYTPDGVPLIANNGAAFNCFVCTGFGDHVADMALGSAKILAKLIGSQASVMLQCDEEEIQHCGKHIEPVMTERRIV
ncbi:hypothetical protein TraAM80_02844 [Trypanosoma rangeli]|uniref:Uncharacterized protein n=1 Tax=Trypanosoma rangeli TaxID=5698 RepID=A0A422NSL0_TRYRA|nr:uncharacterized protein TraAM80_02844 [Trypanosoma rangeli]RNF08384.1 hypothetical protein TraAM80_02844 [Trypanosoma rangeli]|eukprot:RNF08384.1 hypothetical protein TraAM80_02844 [Trypanosoma rangeli]